ncbi:MAG: dienelactone hydrolase family protein [Dehalococcoidia bacterium]|nr:dienelactone hydrolase family protein [Dehalococcoidia bacterium]
MFPYEGMIAETVQLQGDGGDWVSAYAARPLGTTGPLPGVVVVHHMPGWDEWSREVVRKFAQHGYNAVCPNLFHRFGVGSADDVAAVARSQGGASDAQVMGDIDGAVRWLKSLPASNGKAGIIGFCSGGRQVYLAACSVPSLDAAVDCWGGGVIATPEQLNEKRPVAPIDLTERMTMPLLGIFGNDDRSPTPEQVDRTEAELQRLGKTYEFHRYDGAGHGFFATDRPGYRPEQAVDAWGKVFAWYERWLAD